MNEELIFTDDKTLYITLESKIKKWVSALLILLNVGLFSLGFLLLSMAGISALVFFGFIGWFVTRPTLWNVFGKERIIITSDALSFQHHYGLFTTNLSTTKLEHGLAVAMADALTFTEDEYVLFSFYEMNEEETGRLILTSGIKTKKENFDKINVLLKEIFEIPESPKGHSMN